MSNFITQVFDIIADEVGEDSKELQASPETEFADLGVDLVLSRSILTRVRKVTDVDLPQDLFVRCVNAGSLVEFLRASDHAQEDHQPRTQSRTTPNSKLNTSQEVPRTNKHLDQVLAIRLQGSVENAKKTIFLLPDGSGSGMSYAFLSSVDPDVCLYGLNSPYLTAFEEFPPIPEIAPIWAEEIRRIQPKGPYILGGWSAGGYYCFEVAKYLMENVKEEDGSPVQVEKLFLIDSPCRVKFEALPMIVVTTLANAGLVGNWGPGKQPPKWLLDHFDATIARVEEYKPTPLRIKFPSQRLPKVYVLWAESGVNPGPSVSSGLDMSSLVTRFMLQDREDFGPNGWDTLFPRGTEMAIATCPGNHFTIPFPPDSKQLSSLLRDVAVADIKGISETWDCRIC